MFLDNFPHSIKDPSVTFKRERSFNVTQYVKSSLANQEKAEELLIRRLKSQYINDYQIARMSQLYKRALKNLKELGTLQ